MAVVGSGTADVLGKLIRAILLGTEMKKFAADLADFLRHHYPEAAKDGWYRFSADINIVGGEVEVEIPVLTRLPDVFPIRTGKATRKADPFKP